MSFKYVLTVGLIGLWLGSVCTQTEAIEGNLVELYQLTLANSPTVQRQRIQSDIAEAGRQLAASRFDYQLISDATLSRSGFNLFAADPRQAIVGSDINTNNFALSAGLQRTFRSGLITNFSLSYQRTADNYPFTALNEEVGAYMADNLTGTSFSITQPLLRGRGRDIVTAGESLAEYAWESQRESALFVTTGQLFNTVNAYWQYYGAYAAYEVYQQNEERVNAVLEITEQLVRADKKPLGDLTQIRADLKDKERQTILAAQNLFAARQNLGRSLGVEVEASESIGAPTDAFPSLREDEPLPQLADLIALARTHRADVRAIRQQLKQWNTQYELATNDLKPQVNLTLFADYGGSALGNGVDRFFRALANNEGRTYQTGVNLNYAFPLNNNRAQAAQLEAQLRVADQETFLRDQLRNIDLNVSITYQNYLNSVTALRKSKESLDYYEEVFANEQYKFQNGITTLLNLILLQERLTFAQLDYIQSQQRYALAISSLRYETGTLYGSAESTSPALNLFYSLPRQ